MFNILWPINRIHEILLFFMPSFNAVFLSFISPHTVRLPTYTFSAHSTPLLPVIYTVHITVYIVFKPIIYSNEPCGAMQCLHSFTKMKSSSKVDQSVFSSICGLRWTDYETKSVRNIEWLLRKSINLEFTGQWSSQYVSLSTLNLAFI